MPLGDGTTGDTETARDLLGYLIDNPDAEDTLEGIVEWWLLERKIDISIIKVKKALEEMIARDLIVARTGSDSRVRYLINSERREEIVAAFREPRDQSL